jgi:hypothetical protein
MNFVPKIEYIERITGNAKSINFSSPPEGDPFNESYTYNTVETVTNNGTSQTQFNYKKLMYSLEFNFQPETVKEAMLDFMNNHVAYGGKFNYFPHNDEITFEVFELEGKGFALKRPIPSAIAGEFEYDFSLKISRVI